MAMNLSCLSNYLEILGPKYFVLKSVSSLIMLANAWIRESVHSRELLALRHSLVLDSVRE